MNNKGFTLIELLAVILILIGIAGVSVVNITASLRRNDEMELEREKELIINAAKIYFSLNDEICVALNTLIDNEYLKSDDVSKYSGSVGVKKDDGYQFVSDVREVSGCIS